MANRDKLQALIHSMSQVVIGKRDVAELLTCALLCRGHVLVEDVPGVGKTSLALSLARSVGLTFRRIQFTPDVMPSDITGYTMFDQKKGEYSYHLGLVMSQIVLADEINRASPKTQSSLLEAMEERSVTVDGKSYKIPEPFMLLATQNPIDLQGTYPLPEAQLDRFMLKVRVGYPEKDEEEMILRMHMTSERALDQLSPVLSAAELAELQAEVRQVSIKPELLRYMVEIVSATRYHRDLSLGISPRGTIALMQAAQAVAYMDGRSFVCPDDITRMIPYVLAHRLVLKKEAIIAGRSAAAILAGIVSDVTIPTLEKA